MINKYLTGFGNVLSKTPNYVIFYVTARCNARCKMCFYWQNIDQADKTKELSLEEIEKISQSFGFIQYLTLTGGEPTLRDDLAKIARIFDRHNKVQFISIPTNSLLTDKTRDVVEEILRTTKYSYLKLCLSLDGLHEEHDRIRGVPGCFEKVIVNYKNLAKLKKQVKDFEIMINMTISAFNYRKVKQVMDFVRKEMPLAVFDFCWARGDTRENKSKDINAKDYQEILRIVNREEKNFSSGFTFAKIIAANKLVARGFVGQVLREGKRFHPCSAGKKMVIISESGLVKPCEMLRSGFGSLRDLDYDIKKTLSTDRAKEVLKFIEDKRCVCTFENAIQNSIVNNFSMYPLLAKKIISRLFKQ